MLVFHLLQRDTEVQHSSHAFLQGDFYVNVIDGISAIDLDGLFTLRIADTNSAPDK